MVSDSSTASEEIERTLRLERDAAESRIARYRVWLFAFILGSSPLMQLGASLQGRSFVHPLVPVAFYGTLLIYALIVRRLAARYGGRDALVFATVVIDMLAFALPGPLFSRFDADLARDAPLFAAHLLVPGLMLVLFINILRMNRRAAIFGAAVAAAITAIELVSYEGFVPPIAGQLVGIAFTGFLGVAAARQWRHAIETFARLQLLRRFLPPSAVERVLREDPDGAMALGGRTTTVTLIAGDLRGFTQMSENLTPEEVVRQLNAYHGRMLEQIDAHGGALDKFMGDGILAVFGLGVAATELPDAGATQAFACAKAMLASLQELNQERDRQALPPLAMGLGVHTGQVVAGNIGAPGRRLEFTVIGDTVNTTARLEGLTKEAKRPLLVSDATVNRLADALELEQLPPMAVRGREAPLLVYAWGAVPAR